MEPDILAYRRLLWFSLLLGVLGIGLLVQATPLQPSQSKGSQVQYENFRHIHNHFGSTIGCHGMQRQDKFKKVWHESDQHQAEDARWKIHFDR
jgi:hypothetical protein